MGLDCQKAIQADIGLGRWQKAWFLPGARSQLRLWQSRAAISADIGLDRLQKAWFLRGRPAGLRRLRGAPG
jgi:hypothetical protein